MVTGTPMFEFEVEVVDRKTGDSSPLLVEADTEEEARERATTQTSDLIGDITRLGRSKSAQRAHTGAGRPATKRPLSHGQRTPGSVWWTIAAALLAVNGVGFIIASEISASKAAAYVERESIFPHVDRFKEDNAMGATANALEALRSDFKRSSVLENMNARTAVYSHYALGSLALSMLCVIRRSLASRIAN
jgi:hypothetical protein